MRRLASPEPTTSEESEADIAKMQREMRTTLIMTLAVYLMAMLFFLFLAVSGVFADDSPVEPVKKAAKAKPRPKPTPAPCPPWPPCQACPAPEPCELPTFDETPVKDVFPPVERIAAPPVVVLEVPEEGLRLSVQAWSLAAFSGQANERFTYGGRIAADGPVANTWGKPLRMFARLDITETPGATLDLTSIESFGRSAELRGGLYLHLAHKARFGAGDVLNQHITTSIVAWGGFTTMLDDGTIGDRYLRSGGIGVRLAEEVGGAEMVVSYCRDESAGYIGFGQVCVGGSVPILGANGAVILGGNAVLNLSDASVSRQRDILRLWIGVDPGRLLR